MPKRRKKKKEGIDETLQAQIEAQLLSATPIFDSRGYTALHGAAVNGVGVVARLLAACPALIDAVSQDGGTALHSAAKFGQAAIVAQLLDNMKPALIDARAKGGWTALHTAAYSGEAAIVAQLLAAKASIEARTNDGKTVLHCAVISKHSEIVTQLLAAKPTSIEARTRDGQTVLHCALGHDEITALLLAAHPALLDAIIDGTDGWTALRNVIKMNHEEALSRLLAMHPNLIHQSSPDYGWTVFHFAAFDGQSKMMSLLLSRVSQQQLDREQLLLQRTADRTTNGSTALHLAAMKGHCDSASLLLAACPALIDVLDDYGRTCLHCAALSGSHSSTVELLLAVRPALVHAVDAKGNTILHSMIRGSRMSGKELLQRVWKMNPAALHAVNREGQTPFEVAMAPRNDIAIDLLQWGMTFDEILSVCKKQTRHRAERARFKPVLVDLHCEVLGGVLLPDLVGTVFEYTWGADFKQTTKTLCRKRQSTHINLLAP